MKFFLTRRFLPVFVTQFFGAFSDSVFKNAFAIMITYQLVKDDPGKAEILVTLASGLFILPYFLFSSTAGQLADKYDKAKLTRLYKIIELSLMLLATAAFATKNSWFLMILLFAMGTQSTFFGPIKYSVLPQQLKDDELMDANALVEGSTFISILVGTVTGGIAIMLNHGVLIVSSILACSALIGLISAFFIPKAPGGSPELKISVNFLAQSGKMIKDVFTNKRLAIYLLLISWFWLVGSIFLAQTVIFTKNILHGDETVVTFCLTVFSVGIGVGTVFCSKVSKGKASMKYTAASAISIALFILLLVLYSLKFAPAEGLYHIKEFLTTATFWPVILFLFMIAFSGGVFTVPLYTLMQQESPKSSISRTVATNNIINSFFMVASVVIVVVMYSAGMGVEHVLLLLAAVTAAISVLVRFMLK